MWGWFGCDIRHQARTSAAIDTLAPPARFVIGRYNYVPAAITIDPALGEGEEVGISSYAGQTVTLRIHVDTDDTWNSNLFVDDVSFEVADSFFADGFESGDTSAWSDSSP